MGVSEFVFIVIMVVAVTMLMVALGTGVEIVLVLVWAKDEIKQKCNIILTHGRIFSLAQAFTPQTFSCAL